MSERSLQEISSEEGQERALIVVNSTVYHSYETHPHPLAEILQQADSLPVNELITDIHEGPVSHDEAVLAIEEVSDRPLISRIPQDDFEEDFEIAMVGEPEPQDNVLPSLASQSRIRRLMGRAKNAGYWAGAAWTNVSTRNKLCGAVAIAGSAYFSAKALGALDHSAISTLDHNSLRNAANIDVSGHSSTTLVAEVNGRPVNPSTAHHFMAEVNGKPATPSAAHHSAHLTKHASAPVAHNSFVAEVNGKSVHSLATTGTPKHAVEQCVCHTKAAAHQLPHGHTPNHQTTHHAFIGRPAHKMPHTPSTVTLRSGDNPWTESQHALGIPTHARLTPHQLHQIWAYDQHLERLNHIMNENQAEHLSVGTKLKLPKKY